MSFRSVLRFVVLFSFSVMPMVASAQQKGATVHGTVADPDEAVIPGATVTLTPASGKPLVAQSQSDSARSPEATAARQAFLNSPAVKAFRGFIGCAYVAILSANDAQTKGIVVAGGRPTLLYVPSVGLAYVQAPELPQGGGSVRPAQRSSPAPTPAPSSSPR